MLHVTPIPAFTDNYIWLLHNQNTHQAVVIDPGDAHPVQSYCDQNGITLSAVLVTHHHADHIGGVPKLVAQYNIPVFGPAHEDIPNCKHPLKEGDVVVLDSLGIELNVLDIPGHTRGHIAYFGNNWLFCGDTLFAGGCGRLFEGTPDQMLNSLNKLKSLDPNMLVFCAHEYTVHNLEFALTIEPNNPLLKKRFKEVKQLRDKELPTLPSRLQIERDTNPFLRTEQKAVHDTAEHYAQKSLHCETEVFAAIREKKDCF